VEAGEQAIRLFDAEQMDALCDYIKDTHFLIRQ
jgi:hypothetical protein